MFVFHLKKKKKKTRMPQSCLVALVTGWHTSVKGR